MMGLFSHLDALLGVPLDEALAELPIGDDVKQALLEGTGELGDVLSMVIDYCEGNLADIATLDSTRLMKFYLDVVPMARQYVQLSG